ncbi:hypothetical protein [Solirubrobacter pauli]|nr:hypothetical protein [Solirubrobacter pauli]
MPSPRTFMVRALIAGLCVAALAAITALLTGEFEDLHWRIVGTSLGFSFFCALGASGDALREHGRGGLATAGAVATGLAALAFVLLVLAIWFDDSDSEVLWQSWGVAAVTALWASHWSLVLRLRRTTDSPAVQAVWKASIVATTVVMLAGNLAIAEVVGDISDGLARAFGVVLVIGVLTTALPPIMRKLAGDAANARLSADELVRELAEAARRVERITVAEDARREADSLRRLAERVAG